LAELTHYTSEINPNYELVVNEWVGPYKNRYFRKRRYAMLKMLEALKDMEVPINIFGIQSHLNFAKKDYDRDDWKSFCTECKDLGYDLKITEIDLTMQGDERVSNNEQEVLIATSQYLEDTLALGNVKDIICWGLADPYAYAMKRIGWADVNYGATPFNGEFKFNLLGKALFSVLQDAPSFVSTKH
jgi:endo-1,4-beta-xylanase